jgi:hypothetical protein
VDLFHGAVVQESNALKDAVMVDTGSGLSQSFWFRSGDLSVDLPPGFQTKFSQIFQYANITQTQWDTVSKIPDSDTSLTPNDFTMNETPAFTTPLIAHSVYGFYLLGRYPLYSANRVYGMIYLDSTWRENGVFKARIDVKINKNGENRFANNNSITF